MPRKSEMTLSALIELLTLIYAAGIKTWLDGGWGVDSLLGQQSRIHKDVDIVIALGNAERLTKLLAEYGYRVQAGSRMHNFVLADGTGREIDVHAVEFDADGNGVYRLENGADWVYPAQGFTGRGKLGGMEISCLSPEVAVAAHADGYPPQEKDFADMELLEQHFGVVLPPQLERKRDDGKL